MEYRVKATIIIALIFFFLLITVTAVYYGVKISVADRAGTSYESGIMVEHKIGNGKELI